MGTEVAEEAGEEGQGVGDVWGKGVLVELSWW